MFEKIFYGTGFGRERMSALRAGYLFLVWALVPCFLVAMFYRMVVGMAFTGFFAMTSEKLDADVSFRRPFFTWTGDIGLEELSIRPRNPDPEGPGITLIRRVRIDLPNLGVMQEALATASGGGEEDEAGLLRVVDKLDHIGVHVEGMRADGFDALPGFLEYVGAATAAPMEAEGCVNDVLWLNSELPRLGIQNEGIDFHLTLANAPDSREVHLEGELVSPNSSRAQFKQHYSAPSMSAFLDSASEQAPLAKYERLEINDEGFVAARDAYCAKRDGVAPEEFRERHLSAVRRLLQTNGMRPTEELESVYRYYLEHGRLVLEARPNTKVKREDYHHYSIADQAMMYNGTLAAGGIPVPVRFTAVQARAFPESFEGSSWDLVAAEARAAQARAAMLGGEEAAEAMPAAPSVAAAPAKAEVAPPPAAAAPVAAPAPAAKPAPAVAAGALATAPGRAATPAPAKKPVTVNMDELPEWARPATTTRTTVSGKPLASSLPAKKGARRTFQQLRFDELTLHIGERVQLTTVYGDKMDGRVESVSGNLLRLRSAPGMGYAITNFERSKIRSIISME